MSAKKEQIAYFQWLRVLAAAAVVVMHTEGKWWMSISHESAQWQVLTLYDGLVRWPVIIFLMISGALFLPRVTPLKTVLTRYIPRMAGAFLVWSGVYALCSFARGASAAEALALFVSGEYHLWYLPFLCGVYLTLPFVQRIVSDEKLAGELLAVGAVIALGVPWLADLAAALWPGCSGVVRSLENSLNFSFFFDHLSILLLGHWLHSQEQTPKQRRWLYAAGLLCAAVTGPLTIWVSQRTGWQNSLFCDIAAPNNLCTAAALFVFAKYHLTKLPRAVDALAKLSFGIYLSHVLFIDVLAELGFHALAFDPVWAVAAVSAAVFALSAALSWALSKLPGLGKILV